ncbi:putative nuclease HARBI1 isoform X2 [Rhagoletis pomonella]|uniref:putative nuclease HARBI1 isoform X2 n=1 Tax=Rhagoletis pomonella TaxID=28610 RepID=UPI00177B74B7|nr:putative nuclease HARBI1 isoform X2 [Rhagoletis pomonella]
MIFGCAEARRQTKKNRQLRMHVDIFQKLDSKFIESYRVNKDVFKMLLDKIGSRLAERHWFITPTTQLAATLRFLATGSYQLGISKDQDVNIGRSTFSKVLHFAVQELESCLCEEYIQLRMTPAEMNASKEHFYREFNFPGVIGKGYFSINAMVICNYNMEIVAVDASHPGSCHDSFIWNQSYARQFYSNNRAQNTWILADSGYALETFVMTPYRNPQHGSIEHAFNKRHASARNIIERTIGLLKSRFRCLQGTLHYEPKFVAQLVNVCCALHNICRRRNIQMNEENGHDLEMTSRNAEDESDNDYQAALDGGEMRDEVARSFQI